MTRLPESSLWEEEIELISRSERVSGGLDGVANRPLKSLANRTRYLKEMADESGERVAEKVSAVKTFTEGATLESPREEILYGAYRLVWTGDFPKIVPADSTPQGTGGIGAGCWAYTSDAVIRRDLRSTARGQGASLSSLEQGGTVQDAIPAFYVDAFGADPTGRTDSTVAIIKAVLAISGQTDSRYNKTRKRFSRLVFGNGIYRFSDVYLPTSIFITGQGKDVTNCRPARENSFCFITTGTTNIVQATSAEDRLFQGAVCNMSFGFGYQTVGTDNYEMPVIGGGGIQVKNASYMRFENLSFRFLDGVGIDCVELMDSDFIGVKMMSVGNDRDLNNIVPALRVTGDDEYSDSNAIRFNALHIEECPKALDIGESTRHVFFNSACKIEGGATTHSSTFSGVRGLLIEGAELTWQRSDIPMFEMANVTPGISSSYGIIFNAPVLMSAPGTKGWYFHYTSDIDVLQINGMFARDAALIARGSNIKVMGGSAFRCNATLFDLYGNSEIDLFHAINIVNTENGNSISLSGTGNAVRNCTLHSNGSLTDNTAAIAVGATATDAVVADNKFGGTRNYAINLGNTLADKNITDNKQIAGANFATFIKNSQPRRSFTQAKGKAGVTNGTIAVSPGAEGWVSIVGQGALLALHCAGSDGATRTAVILTSYEINFVNLISQTGTLFKTDTTGAAPGNGFVYLTKAASSDQLRITNYSNLTLTLSLAGLTAALTS